jgi:2-polyprenyl-3-methyl-5-hydroxy-6-metoxy-1,4-benzoquinol methylase
MSLPRRLEPEWLDHLPAEDPRAMRSRLDLKRVNRFMGNANRMAKALLAHAPSAPRTIIDLGSGDGQFMLAVARRLAPRWSGVTVVLLDQQNIVSQATRAGFAALGWRAEPTSADVFNFLAQAQAADIVTANLFLHHFADAELTRLLAQIANKATLMVACEPRRSKLVVEASRLLWMVGCNDVSVHDAVVSARAGFNGQELSALWPRDPQWQLQEHTAGLFSHRFIARRRQD